ncbi:glycosyltransferase family 2 protein [Pseudomonadota bacterium]
MDPLNASKTVVVIPAYNEAKTIVDVALRVLAQQLTLIVVDDASEDGTSECLADMGVTVLRNEQNLGKGGSLWRGMQFALELGADVVITLDGDGQHRPEDIPLVLNAADAYPETIIIAARKLNNEQAPKARKAANNIADFWISWAAGYPISDSQSGFRLYPAKLIRSVSINTSTERGFVFESEILIKAVASDIFSHAVAIPSIYEKGARPSHFRPVRDIVNITLMVAAHLIRHGLAPLRLLRSLRLLPQPRIGR